MRERDPYPVYYRGCRRDLKTIRNYLARFANLAPVGRGGMDNQPIEQPFPFRRLLEDPDYHGYMTRPGAKLNREDAEIHLGEKQFLPFGDNTRSSLDGRYFGPSFFVYWPFGAHWSWSC